MEDFVGVSYSEWLSYVKTVREKGQRCEKFGNLQHCYPICGSSTYEIMVQNELAKLETVLLKKAINKFQNSVNQCLEEEDLEIAEKAIRDFKKRIKACYFFVNISGYPLAVRKKLPEKIKENLLVFMDEFAKYIKRFTESDNSYFAQEFEYMYKKVKLKTFIQECNVDG